MKVILISGKAGHGKDTAAVLMAEAMEADGKDVLIIHFADALKFICRRYFGWDGVKDENGRHLLQWVGTDVVRKYDPEFWAKFVAGFLKSFEGLWDYVIIPDTRFPNEISVMKDYGFDTINVMIKRDDYEGVLTEDQKDHESETALDGIKPDNVIHNSGTLDNLENIINDWIKENLYEGI